MEHYHNALNSDKWCVARFRVCWQTLLYSGLLQDKEARKLWDLGRRGAGHVYWPANIDANPLNILVHLQLYTTI